MCDEIQGGRSVQQWVDLKGPIVVESWAVVMVVNSVVAMVVNLAVRWVVVMVGCLAVKLVETLAVPWVVH